MKSCILYFVKYPEPGTVKTRLARGATPELAAEFYRTFAADKLMELAETEEADVLVCFAPEAKRREVAEWLPGFQLFAQKGDDLGGRMENAFRHAFRQGCDRAILVGSDVPGLTPELMRRGFESLTPESAALGPAEDGGYYLIGFHREGFAPEPLRNMEWSRDDVFQRTKTRLLELGLRCKELERLSDIDTPDDLVALVKGGVDGPLSGKSLELAKRLTET